MFPNKHAFYSKISPACHFVGDHPQDGDGRLKVVLTSESAEVLEKVPGLQRWHVGPPMTRGSKSVTVAAKAKPKAKAIHVKAKTKKEKPTVEEHEPKETDIKRSKAGRRVIENIMYGILELDDKTYPLVPAFDYQDNGKCRLKFEGADTLSWEIIKDSAADCFECMCPGSSSSFF